jgi:hypothetical protein
MLHHQWHGNDDISDFLLRLETEEGFTVEFMS